MVFASTFKIIVTPIHHAYFINYDLLKLIFICIKITSRVIIRPCIYDHFSDSPKGAFQQTNQWIVTVCTKYKMCELKKNILSVVSVSSHSGYKSKVKQQ